MRKLFQKPKSGKVSKDFAEVILKCIYLSNTSNRYTRIHTNHLYLPLCIRNLRHTAPTFMVRYLFLYSNNLLHKYRLLLKTNGVQTNSLRNPSAISQILILHHHPSIPRLLAAILSPQFPKFLHLQSPTLLLLDRLRQ
jgi:hypothetical protein